VYVLSLPLLVVLALKDKYKNSIPSRFFLSQNPPFKEGGVWFHVCSFGEARAIKPFVKLFEDKKINISVITQTGFDEAKKYKADVRFLPYEIFVPFWIKRDNFALIGFEAELWLMPFFLMRSFGKKTVLLNARISDKSYKAYKRFRLFYRFIFQNIDMVFAQSTKDAKRLSLLGAKNIEVIGNVKMFQEIKVAYKYKKPQSLIITAGSTHEKEEELIANAFVKFSNEAKLLIVPRHPQRFDQVDKVLEKIAKKNALSYHRFSHRADFDSDIVLFDKLGELNEIYAISDIVILGGAFNDRVGGHNPLEPEFFKCKLISGKHIFNQQAIFENLQNVIFADENVESLSNSIEKAKNAPPVKVKYKPDIDKIKEKIKGFINA